MYLFFTAGYFLVLLWGAAGIRTGSVTYGSLIAFLQIISQLRSPMQSISGIAPTYYSMMSSAERITEIDDLNDELSPLDKDVTDAIKNIFTCIKAEKLSFSYGEHKILNECEFSVQRGSITAITGESGVGKSTLFRLLLGYESAEGKLSFDNKYEINSSTRSLFSYVPQGNMILSGTISENITLCTVNADDNAIKNAIQIAQLSDFIESLPKGLDTYIGEDGLGVSEGQAQRIAIARAILCDAPILLLDEASASLDRDTEYRLLKEIKSLSDKTVFLVTHRNLPDDICDNIIHLEDGKFQNK
jgi:ABC-type bacteriocin/lantibiotic exporter with double-glycine peptidase domain